MSGSGDDESHLSDDEDQTHSLHAIDVFFTYHACFALVIQLVVKDGF